MVTLASTLSSFGDWISLGDFATWLDASQAVAKSTLDEFGINHVRIGSRGMYRISVTSVAAAFNVPQPTNDDDAPSEAVITKPHLEGSAVVNAAPPEGRAHAAG